MTILLVTPWNLSDIGGVSVAVRMLASQFRKRGHRVLVLTLDGDGHPRYKEETEEASVYSAYLRIPYVEQAPIRGLIGYSLYLPWTLYQLRRLLKRHKVDIVAIHYPMASASYFGILRRFSHWKLVVTYQGSDAHELPQWPKIDQFLVKYLLGGADYIVAVSKSLQLKVLEQFPSLEQRKHYIIPNGAPIELIDQVSPVDRPADLPDGYIFSAGLLVPRKGFDVLIKAVAFARHHGTEIHVVIAGEGPERQRLEEMADANDISTNVKFVGPQSHRSVLTLMKGSRHFVLASHAEGLPLVIAEAMACAKAVVATDVDGASQIVEDGKTGILVKSGDTESLAQALIKLHGEPQLCEALGRNGREWALRAFSWDNIADRYLRLFKESVPD